MEQIDARVLELMASRLCHEFVGPLGAVANGVELIEDTEGSIAEEAMGMVGDSAKELVSRIKFYRIAYGVSVVSADNLAEIRSLAGAFFREGEGRLNWPMPPMAPRLEDGEGKLVLNMISLAKSALSPEGEVKVDIESDDLVVSVLGERVSLPDELVDTMVNIVNPIDMTPRNVHGFWASFLARSVGRTLRYEVINDQEIQIKA